MLQGIENQFRFNFMAAHALKYTGAAFESDIITLWQLLLAQLQPVYPALQQAAVKHNMQQTIAGHVLTVWLLSVHAFDLHLHILPLILALFHTHTRSNNRVGFSWTFALQHSAGSAPANPVARQSKPITVWGQMVNLYNIHFPASFSELACHPPEEELCTRAQCPRRPSLNWLNSLSRDLCTSPSSHGEDTCSKQLLHIPDGRARQMSKENQRERQGKVYEPAFASLNEKLSIPSSKTGCSWRNSWPRPCLWLSWSSPLTLSPTHRTATAQRVDSISCLFSALCLNHKHSGTSGGGLAQGFSIIIKFYPFCIVTLNRFIVHR